MVKFLRAGEKVEIWNFIGLFSLRKSNFSVAELETRVQILLKLSTALYCQERKLLCRFLLSQFIFETKPTKEIWKFDGEISSSWWKGGNLKFHELVLSTRQLVWVENLYSSFLSWEGRAVQSFSKIWMVVSNSAYQKTLKFLWAGQKAKISNFISWFCLKGKLPEQKIYKAVSSPDSEGLSKVSAKSESWFPIQHIKKTVKFLQAGEKAKISNFMSWFSLKDKLLD